MKKILSVLFVVLLVPMFLTGAFWSSGIKARGAVTDGNLVTWINRTTVEDGGIAPIVPAGGEFDLDGNVLVGQVIAETFVIAEPDVVVGKAEVWTIKHFPAEAYPNGVTVLAFHISTRTTCTDSIALDLWTNNGTAWSKTDTMEFIVLSGTHTEDDGEIYNNSIPADSYLRVDLDDTPTDIAAMSITVVYKVNAS